MVIPVVSTRGFCFQSGSLSRDRAGRSGTGYSTIKLSTPGRTGGCMSWGDGNKDSVVDESGCCWTLSRNYFNRETICHPLFFSLFIVFLSLSFLDIFPRIFVFACHIVPSIRRRSYKQYTTNCMSIMDTQNKNPPMLQVSETDKSLSTSVEPVKKSPSKRDKRYLKDEQKREKKEKERK